MTMVGALFLMLSPCFEHGVPGEPVPEFLSEDFYAALMAGELAHYDDFDETRTDFSRWKGIYETWLRRKQAYTTQIKQREVVNSLRFQPIY
jgi:hypothetical protein